jgi:hypothetical protein
MTYIPVHYLIFVPRDDEQSPRTDDSGVFSARTTEKMSFFEAILCVAAMGNKSSD